MHWLCNPLHLCVEKPEFNHKDKTVHLHRATLLCFSKSRGPDKEFQLAPSVLSESAHFFFFLLYYCCDCVALPLPHALLPFAHNPRWLLTGQDKTSAASHRAHKGPAAHSLASSRLASRPGTRFSIPVAIDGTLLTSCSDSPSSSLISPTNACSLCVCESLPSATRPHVNQTE